MGRKKVRVSKNCLQCEKEFETFPSEIKKGGGKFCSRSCATTYRNIHNNPTKDAKVREKISKNHADVSGQNNPMYGRRGKLSPGYIDGRKMYPGDRYKRILLASGEFPKCKLCGKCSGKIQVHHIDGNHENNEVSNLMFLCQKCHMTKAHTFLKDIKGRVTGVLLNKFMEEGGFFEQH